MKFSRLRTLFLWFVVFAAVLTGAFAWWAARPVSGLTEARSFEVPQGAGLREIARRACTAVDMPELPFVLMAEFGGHAARMRAGTYSVAPGTTPFDLLEKLVRGEVDTASLTVVEGWTFAQMRAAVARTAELRQDTAALGDAELMEKLGARGVAPEGRFFPDTYRFAKGASDLTIYRQAYEAMRKALAAAWDARAPTLALDTPDEALILASIIEKETGTPDDRRKIATVFHNRLRLGMLLQTDPTVIYGLGERFDGNLRRRDLLADTPYNTYVRPGLPPAPIALPGRAALEAALHPAPGNALYFVARGDGSSEFSSTLDAHNRAVNKYQRRQ